MRGTSHTKPGTCFLTARVDKDPPSPHFYLLFLRPPPSLTPNCRWSDLHWADAEWRLDKRNHPDSQGWSGQWLAAAPAPQLGPLLQALGGQLATGHHWLTGPVWTGRGWVVGCWDRTGQVLWGQGHDSRRAGVGEGLGPYVQSWVTGWVGGTVREGWWRCDVANYLKGFWRARSGALPND